MNDLVTSLKKGVLGVQMLFVAFGALVLVPLLTGLDPSIALFTAGIGTLIFQLITKYKVPVFLASSFAFIAPIQFATKEFGIGKTLGGLAAIGVIYAIFSLIIKLEGHALIHKILPPVVTGPVIMVIGLNLAPVAVGMCLNRAKDTGAIDPITLTISLITLLTVIITVVYGGKFFSLIPVLMAILVGFITTLIIQMTMGVTIIDFSPFHEAAWFNNPWTAGLANGTFEWPQFDWSAIIYMLPVALAPAIEHVGDVLAISSVTGKDYLDEPGLERTMLGDGVATSVAALLGGPPNTTYSEVTGAVALTKAFNPVYMTIAAVTAIVLAFCGKLGALLRLIPAPVMGGIMIVLFGMIAAVGIGSMVKAKLDMNQARNLIIVAVILVFGIGNMELVISSFKLGGIGLAGLVGIVLNMVLPKEKVDTESAASEVE